MSSPRLLLVYPPRHDAATRFRTLATGLSERFRGTILTASEEPADLMIGRFRVLSVPRRWGKKNEANARMLRAGSTLVLQARRKGDPFQLVSAYDPLRTGLLASALRVMAAAKLVVEINGDYATPVNYATIADPRAREAKRLASIATQRVVLAQADGIKPLHAGLLHGVPYPRAVVDIFPTLVELDRFTPMQSEPLVLFAGFPFHLKGVDVLLEAFKRVAPRHPDWKLEILGFYPDRTELEAHIGGHPQIFHHPPVEPINMPAHMGRCAIFVLPSRSEAMGRVLLEAAAAGKARIGSRVGGIPQVIEHERDGLLFESEDVEALAAHLDRSMSDPTLRERLGTAARERVVREFSSERFFERLFAFYDAVLASPPRWRSGRVRSGRASPPR